VNYQPVINAIRALPPANPKPVAAVAVWPDFDAEEVAA
jgi:hypothetical protein